MVFPFLPFPACFVLYRSGSGTKQGGTKKGRTEPGGRWQGVNEKRGFMPNAVGVGLARNRRGPKRPSEPRLSGVHPEAGAVGEKELERPRLAAGW